MKYFIKQALKGSFSYISLKSKTTYKFATSFDVNLIKMCIIRNRNCIKITT